MFLLNNIFGNVFLSILSGLMLSLAFPKPEISFLAWFALIPLFFSTNNLKNVFLKGFLTGFIHFSTILYWLFYTLKSLVGFNIFICLIFHLVLSSYLAIYIALFTLINSKLNKNPLINMFISPAIWIIFEYLRTYILTGFPWCLIGYSQYKFIHVIQIADIFGVYGISFLIIMSNIVFFNVLLIISRNKKKLDLKKNVMFSLIIFIMFFCISLLYGQFKINQIETIISKSPFANFAVIQGNIDQSKKWDPLFKRKSETKYLKMSKSQKKNYPDLIIWPETALTFYFQEDNKRSNIIKRVIKSINTFFLIGTISYDTLEDNEKDKFRYYNSAYLINNEGKICDRYNKIHMVPFGEYIPLNNYLKFFKKIVYGENDYSSGKQIKAISWKNYKLCVQICYEIIFPELSRKTVKKGANIIINMTNDAWLGKTNGPYQHFSMSIFRAVENRRSLIRCANTGISGMINPVGRIIYQTQILKNNATTINAPLLNNYTIFTNHGEFFLMICILSGVIILSVFIRYYSFFNNKTNDLNNNYIKSKE